MNLNTKAKKQNSYDAIVVGSGATGGWAAKELTEKGLKVLMLERGRNLEHVTGYETAKKHPWEFKYRGRITTEQRKTHPYLSRDYPYSEHNESYWIKDIDYPYTEEKRFDWYRANILGGKSVTWGRQSYRLSDLDFEANSKDGYGIDWPFRYKDLAPWYDYVEEHIGVSGANEGIDNLPDGKFMPPMDMTCVETKTREALSKKFGRTMTIGRAANVTKGMKNRVCMYRNKCSRGCPYGGYFSTQSSTLPPAQETGNLTLLTDAIVTELVYNTQQERVVGVKATHSGTGEEMEFFSKIVFVNASTLWSTYLLLKSKSDRFPNGLGNDSGVLGKYLMDHHFRVGASGSMPGFEDKYYYGNRPNGIYVIRYQNIGDDKRKYLRGFGYQGGGSRRNWWRGVKELAVGKELKNQLIEPGQWQMGMGGFGETLPYEDNYVTLDETNKDKWGQPTLKINCEFRENEKEMRKDMMNDAAEMLEAAGAKDINATDWGSTPGQAIHEAGTVRMGKDPKQSVLNGWGQMHNVKNVFVTDASCMPSIGCQNPTLTIMAITARAADYAVKEMKKQNL